MRIIVLLLLFAAIGCDAFTFTCNQVKKLIRDQTSFKTDFACVSLDEFIKNAHFTNEVYFEDNGRGRYSFAEVAGIGCVGADRAPSWTIVTDRADGGEGIECEYEFTAFFSSISSHIITAGNDGLHHRSYSAANLTVVAPRGGLLIDFSCNNTKEPLNFYTGLGGGAAEDMFYYGSSACDDRLSVFAWDTAVTVNLPGDGYVLLTYFGTGGYLALGSVAYDFIVLGSGKSNNIIQQGEDDKFVWLTPSLDGDLQFHIDGYAQMDQTYGNSLVVAAQCKQNNCTGSINPITDTNVHMIIEADFLAIDYLTSVPEGIWKDGDLFFLKIVSTPLDATEAPPTLPPPKASTDYSCGCDLVNGEAAFSSSLWLDVVFIVDVSQAMGIQAIQKASTMIDAITAALTIGNTLVGRVPDDRTSRVALIAVSDKAEVLYDLASPLQPAASLLNLSLSAEADIGSGIESALSLFSSAPFRSTRQLIYVIAVSDSSSTDVFVQFSQSRILQTRDATWDAEAFKMGGGIIAVMEADAALSVSSFRKLASDGYFTEGFNEKGVQDLQLLCDANCFCPSAYTTFTSGISERKIADRGCLLSQPSTLPYLLAKEACQGANSLLSTIHDAEKQFFLLQMISSFGSRLPFWIGFENFDHSWEWIDNTTSTFVNWAEGQPDSTGSCAISQQKNGLNSAWSVEDCSNDHLYICEKAPCSVASYCSL